MKKKIKQILFKNYIFSIRHSRKTAAFYGGFNLKIFLREELLPFEKNQTGKNITKTKKKLFWQ